MKPTLGLAFILLVSAAAPVVSQEGAPVFRAEARLVEVYATVVDHRGHYLDSIPQQAFHISDNGRPQPIVSFENGSSKFSCAILLDTTGSMRDALPTVKNAINRFIDELRDDDSVAIYSFSTSTEMLQDFTSDKTAAKRSLMRTRAAGMTALFDALTRVTLDLGSRRGKRALVVYTDGDDNASSLNAQHMIERARKSGVPVYTVAQGEARQSATLMNRLKDIARLTGGRTYGVKDAHEAAQIVQDISAELQHTYLLSYQPPESREASWHQIQVSLEGIKDYAVRSKEGYSSN